MTNKSVIENLISKTMDYCASWITELDGTVQFVDPLDHKEISAHYGATHAAAAMMLYGIRKNDSRYEELGLSLLQSVLKRWETSKVLPGFHNDFNNFALCTLTETLPENKYGQLIEEIKRKVLSTSDSNHDTINWLPMRWYVNLCRYTWTKEERYTVACQVCRDKIKRATYDDGFIDDRLPKGLSFNLQYDVATVAVMQFLSVRGEEVDLSKEFGALLAAVAPDGDINYFGRGTNQVFAWGLWIYLLASAGMECDLEKALNYCAEKILVMLEKNNLMLNEWEGAEKYLWWDYHYCSVYTAHFLFWLVLAQEDYGKKAIVPVLSDKCDSGIEIIREAGWFVVIFSGRTEYLAERGPAVVALGLEDGRMFVKGAFGPWQGAFGKMYTIYDTVLKNCFGVLHMSINSDYSHNRLMRKIFQKKTARPSLGFRPVFVTFNVTIGQEKIEFSWENTQKKNIIFNCCVTGNFVGGELFEDYERVPFPCVGLIRNQYGFQKLYQSRIMNRSVWKLVINI